jgi:hypothetical protein
MKKVAFFVEGISEQIFVEKLLVEIFGRHKISIETIKISGGKNSPIKKAKYPFNNSGNNSDYFAVIYDCGGDSTVKSYILEERESLIKANYLKIIGLLDVYPRMREDILKFKRGLNYGTPTKDIEIAYVLSIMEIESWFLAEYSHFEKIDSLLTIPLIVSKLGFNPQNDNMELRDCPAIDLRSCYELVGKGYNKSKLDINRTVQALDFSVLYLVQKNKMASLNELITTIESAFEIM